MSTGRELGSAPVVETGPIPAYKVYEYTGEVHGTVAYFDEKTRTVERKDIVIDGGYLVVFAKGHSAFYKDLKALEKAGLGEIVPIIQHGQESEMNKEHEDKLPKTQRKIEREAS